MVLCHGHRRDQQHRSRSTTPIAINNPDRDLSSDQQHLRAVDDRQDHGIVSTTSSFTQRLRVSDTLIATTPPTATPTEEHPRCDWYPRGVLTSKGAQQQRIRFKSVATERSVERSTAFTSCRRSTAHGIGRHLSSLRHSNRDTKEEQTPAPRLRPTPRRL